MYKKIMPIGWHILNKIPPEDLFKLGSGNVRYFKRYCGNIKAGLESTIEERRTLLDEIEGKRLRDIRKAKSITRFGHCGQCDFAVVEDVREGSGYLHACKLLPPELREYIPPNMRCIIACSRAEILAKCVKGLREEIATLTARKKRVDAHYEAFCKADMYADEKPCFSFVREIDHFAPGEKVVCFVGDTRNVKEKNFFVKGVVQEIDQDNKNQLTVVTDSIVHNNMEFYGGKGMIFCHISPELMREKEFMFLVYHPKYRELWLKVAEKVSGADFDGMTAAFASHKTKK